MRILEVSPFPKSPKEVNYQTTLKEAIFSPGFSGPEGLRKERNTWTPAIRILKLYGKRAPYAWNVESASSYSSIGTSYNSSQKIYYLDLELDCQRTVVNPILWNRNHRGDAEEEVGIRMEGYAARRHVGEASFWTIYRFNKAYLIAHRDSITNIIQVYKRKSYTVRGDAPATKSPITITITFIDHGLHHHRTYTSPGVHLTRKYTRAELSTHCTMAVGKLLCTPS